MNQQPDKFFREKLEDYNKPAPSAAWDRIAAAQPKKNHKGLWLKIAASLLLLAGTAYLLWFKADPVHVQQNNLTVAPKEQPASSTPQHKQEPLIATESDVQAEAIAKTQQASPTKSRRTKKVEPVEVTLAQETKPEVIESISTPEEIELPDPQIESMETTLAEVPSAPTSVTENITLVFTAKEVNEYLDKNALAQATSEEKKPSTLKKLLKKANDLKNNQDPFGELRQKKNEILALNFKNEKQRGQNK